MTAGRTLFVIALLAAAGCDSPTPTQPGPSVTISGTTVSILRVTGNAALGAVGETSQLQAIATMTNGDTADVTNVASWITMTVPSVIRVSRGPTSRGGSG